MKLKHILVHDGVVAASPDAAGVCVGGCVGVDAGADVGVGVGFGADVGFGDDVDISGIIEDLSLL